MNAYDKTSIQINRCKRILDRVDDYVDCPITEYRTALRKALMEEFEAPAIAPPVAAGSVDTSGFHSIAEKYRACHVDVPYPTLVKVIDAWGVQQREAGKAEQTAFLKECMDRGQDEFNRKWTEQKERAEKAEAAFKNFHRSLCDRFGYMHDPVNWRRDQVSLEEYIAAKLAVHEIQHHPV